MDVQTIVDNAFRLFMGEDHSLMQPFKSSCIAVVLVDGDNLWTYPADCDHDDKFNDSLMSALHALVEAHGIARAEDVRAEVVTLVPFGHTVLYLLPPGHEQNHH